MHSLCVTLPRPTMNSEDVVKDAPEEDLEDGEIEDDDEEELLPPPTVQQAANVDDACPFASATSPTGGAHKERRSEELERAAAATPGGGEKHKKKHLTEAEKSVMKLHKLERMEREKREKYRREQMHAPEPVDDYAVSLEKALAKVLKKDQKLSDDEQKHEEEPKRGKKRKKKDKHKKVKRNRQESPKLAEDDIERERERRSPDTMERGASDGESSDTGSSSDKNELRKRQLTRELRRENAKNRRDRRDRSREREMQNNRQCFKKLRKRNVGICLYYLQGKCNDEHCQYSHDCVPPLKLELCKFYLLDCCAKGDKCLYMHSDFPCKYYHTGIPCPFGDECKFAHGGPLAESVKQILFKHIETAPKEILGNFPRLSRENAHMMITQAQKNLEMKKLKEKEELQGGHGNHGNSHGGHAGHGNHHGGDGGYESDGKSQTQSDRKEKRNRPSRWQDPEPEKTPNANVSANANTLLSFVMQQQQQQQKQHQQGGFKDQDMRISSNGDVDMRSLHNMPPPTSIHPTDIVNPNIFTTKPPPILPSNLMSLQGLNLLQIQQNAAAVAAAAAVSAAAGGYGMMPGRHDAMATASSASSAVDIEKYKMDAAATKEKPKEEDASLMLGRDVDLRVPPPHIAAPGVATPPRDTDIRHLNAMSASKYESADVSESQPDEEDALQIVMDDDAPASHARDGDGEEEKGDGGADAAAAETYELPKVQRDLFARIQQQQKTGTADVGKEPDASAQDDQEQNIDWYSDDEDDNKLTIEHDDEEHDKPDDDSGRHSGGSDPRLAKDDEKTDSPAEPPDVPALAKSGGAMDFSKIDISEVSKLLSTIKENTTASATPKDPRTKDPRARDPRLAARQSSVDEPPQQQQQQPMTIYDQTAFSAGEDGGVGRLARADVDLRMGIHFKSMGNYTPASEIDASMSAHPAMSWKVYIVEIPKPDYTGLKLSASDAHTSGDPRLRKIFRLSTEEKDSPASPGTSPKPTAPRVDPRRKKAMEAAASNADAQAAKEAPATYAQQLSTLQSSPFYQTLTSNQKLMLNQELANCNDQSGLSDPIVSAMLSNLGLNQNVSQQHTPQQTGQALNILNSLAGFSQSQLPQHLQQLQQNPQVNPLINLNVAPPNLGQGLLGPAPGHIQDFPALNQLNSLAPLNQMNFDPRGGGGGPMFGHQHQPQQQQQQQQHQQPPPIGDFPMNQAGNNSDHDEYGPLYDNSQDYDFYQQRRERNHRRGRNNNNNNRNRNNFFRHSNRNNRNRNSPS